MLLQVFICDTTGEEMNVSVCWWHLQNL